MRRADISRHFAAWLLLAVVLPWSAGAQTAAPQVASTQPHTGDEHVASELKEIVISFDQDMDVTGYSFIGGGPSFPKVAGKPAWRGKRECVLPVQLEAGQAYTVGINSATKGGFKSLEGVAATPFVLSFKTRGMPGAETPANVQAESVRQLREAIEKRYSYRDVHAVDWPKAWQALGPRLLRAKTAREFAVTAGEMLAATQDAHIWLLEGGQIVAAFRRMVTPNANIKLLPSLVTGWSQKHPMIAAGHMTEDVAYIAIHSWERKHAPQLLEAALAALDECKDKEALILDLRFNSGGDETIAREFASCFIREPKVYARHVTLDASAPGGFSAAKERSIKPSATRAVSFERIAVLMGPVNMSSAEAFLLMMKQAPGCTLVGARSYGASGNPQPHVLANGVTVMLPSWKAMLPDGTEFEAKGVAPDVEVSVKAEDFATRDPVLEKALEIVKP